MAAEIEKLEEMHPCQQNPKIEHRNHSLRLSNGHLRDPALKQIPIKKDFSFKAIINWIQKSKNTSGLKHFR